MLRLTILASVLVTLGVRSADDTDPEPPRLNTVFARIVTKKTSYKLDLGGSTAEEYRKAAKQGTARAIPVEMELVITNGTKNTVRVRVSGAVPKLTLKLEGTGAVDSKDPTVTKGPLRYQELKPGQKVSIPINSLLSYQGSKGGTIRHYWTEPGEYKLSASFYTSLDLDWKGGGPKGKLNYTTLQAPAITIKVEK
jgi:hypothetical protein